MLEEAFPDSTAWRTCSSMAKLTVDLNHDLGTKTHLCSLRDAVDPLRVKGLMMPNLLPGRRKYSSTKRCISVEIRSKLCIINRLALNLCFCFVRQKRTSQLQLKYLLISDSGKYKRQFNYKDTKINLFADFRSMCNSFLNRYPGF